VHPVEGHPGVELLGGGARQAERLDPVAGVVVEGALDGPAQGAALELGAQDPAQVALDDEALVAEETGRAEGPATAEEVAQRLR
jgi:hypothetical protein